jgi:Glyoxalase-like domain
MTCELDHVSICVAAGAPEADELIRFGLIEGAANRHPGQGTANRRFFFAGAFLELLWVDDPAEAAAGFSLVTKERTRRHDF